jgi:hypothetical protein
VGEHQGEQVAIGKPIHHKDALAALRANEAVTPQLIDGPLRGHAADLKALDDLLNRRQLLAGLPPASGDALPQLRDQAVLLGRASRRLAVVSICVFVYHHRLFSIKIEVADLVKDIPGTGRLVPELARRNPL